MNNLKWILWYKWIYHIKQIPWYSKEVIRKIKNGCTHSEVIDLDISFFKWVQPRLKVYKEICIAYPTGFYDESLSPQENELELKVLLDRMLEYVNMKLEDINSDLYIGDQTVDQITIYYNKMFNLEKEFWRWFPKLGF